MERSAMYQLSAPLLHNGALGYDTTDAPLQHNGGSIARQRTAVLRRTEAEATHLGPTFGTPSAGNRRATERSLMLRGYRIPPPSDTNVAGKGSEKGVFPAKTSFHFVLIFHSYLE